MFAAERHKLIKQLLVEKKFISVTELSRSLNVSEVTIRRDLEKLEDELFLMRTHGGAILCDNEFEPFSAISTVDDNDEAELIASIAASMIADGSIIFLGAGKLGLATAKKLNQKQDLIVLTNDISIAVELAANTNIKINLPGGELSPSLVLTGAMAYENMASMHVAHAFMEVVGVDLTRGFTVRDMDSATTLKMVAGISDQNTLLCCADAFDRISLHAFGPIKLAESIITSPNIPDQYKEYCFQNNIRLFTAFDI